MANEFCPRCYSRNMDSGGNCLTCGWPIEARSKICIIGPAEQMEKERQEYEAEIERLKARYDALVMRIRDEELVATLRGMGYLKEWGIESTMANYRAALLKPEGGEVKNE